MFKTIFIASLFINPARFSNYIVNERKVHLVEGYFTTTKHEESIYVIKSELNADGTGCIGKCKLTLFFSCRHTPTIAVDDCTDGTSVNLEDFNGDGKDEI